MSEFAEYVDSDYLDLTTQVLQMMKRRSHEFMRIHEGDKLLDVGCGPASDTIDLAKQVGNRGEVVGVDVDEQMVREAGVRAQKENVDQWVKHYCRNVYELGFETGYFDACKSERVFIHLDNPERALREMIRVTKPGGRIVVVDADWGTYSIDTDEIETERRLTRYMAEKFLRNGYSGKRLYRQFRENKLSDIRFEWVTLPITNYGLAEKVFSLSRLEGSALSAGIITQAELERWRRYLEHAAVEGTFFLSVSGVVISGVKL